MAPELEIVFPDVEDIAISRSLFSVVKTGQIDTVNLALVRFTKPMPEATKKKLREYLETRLKTNNIEIVTIPSQKHNEQPRNSK